MSNLSSVPLREETPHISDAVGRRAQSIINNKSIDAPTRTIIRYGLEINDPWLPELVRCVDAGESIIDNLYVHSSGKDRSINQSDLPSRRRTLGSPARSPVDPRKLHPPKSPREHSETPCFHSLRRTELVWHGRRTD